MPNSNDAAAGQRRTAEQRRASAESGEQRRNAADRRAFVERWAAFVRTHDDAEWSRRQNRLVDSQLQTANEMAARGETDPVRFVEARDERRRDADADD